jgi:hypothetical protein
VRTRGSNIPLLLGSRRVLFLAVHNLPLPWQRTLQKRALLLVELAQHAEHSALVYDTPTLPPAAGVAGPLSPCSNVGDWANCGRHRFARDVVLLARQRLVLLLGAGGGDGDGSRALHSRLYSHGSRHVACGRTRGPMGVR